MLRTLKGFLVFVVLVPTMVSVLTGCWDKLEIEDRALILAMAVDKASPEEQVDEHVTHVKPIKSLQGKMIRLTVQIAVPGRVPLGPGESSGAGEGASNLPVWVVKVFGYTIDDALNTLQQQIADPRTLIHLRVIVVSEEVAKSGLGDVNDYFRRNPQVRRSTWLLISDREAAPFMDVAPPLERVPALYLLAMLQKANDMGKFPADFVGEFWSSESKLGQEGYLPFVSIRQKENILLKGLAYFKDSKMVGHTNALEIGVFMGIMGYNPGGYSPLVEVPDIGVVILNVLRRDTKRQIKMIDGEPHVFLNIKMETSIDEVLSEATIDSESKLKKVEEEFKHTSYDAFENLIRRTQKVNSDIFGFGELIRAHERSYWNEHVKSESDWERLYGELPITTTVKVVVRRIGLTE